ncbi:MAG TPA: SCO family protein [Acidobacteriota bacterium]|nr:SCO family protein [Acidobacteriota bacterium]
MTIRSVVIGVVLAAFIVAGWVAFRLYTRDPAIAGQRPDKLEVLWEAPEFSLINSRGETVTRQDLSGYVWVADFMFTRCPGPCPLMTRAMLELQEIIQPEEPVRFVSISVDPAYDRPQVLARYARRYGADTSRWHFLTGPPDDTVRLVVNGFFTAVQRGRAESAETAVNPSEIIHGTHFLLIDVQGRVRGIYDIADPDFQQRLVRDIRRLSHSAVMPS